MKNCDWNKEEIFGLSDCTTIKLLLRRTIVQLDANQEFVCNQSDFFLTKVKTQSRIKLNFYPDNYITDHSN